MTAVTTHIPTAATELSEEADLLMTRNLRAELVKSMVKQGVPTDPKEQQIFLAALNDMDRSALSLKKIKSDEGLGNKQLAAAALLAQVFNDPRIKQIDKVEDIVGSTRVIPELDESFVPSAVTPGELDTTPPVETYASFTERMGMNQ